MHSLGSPAAPAPAATWRSWNSFGHAPARCHPFGPCYWPYDHEHVADSCYNVRRYAWEVAILRRWLFFGVLSGAMMLSQVAFAAGSAVQGVVVDMDALLVGVITVAVFLWIYSMIA